MPSFILIDQSLRSVGGHPFDYAVHVLSAAKRAGYQPVLATHRKFKNRNTLLTHVRVLPCFRYSTYSKFALYCSGGRVPPPMSGMEIPEDPVPAGLCSSLFRSIGSWFYKRARETQLRSFSRTCSKLFATLNLQPGDHVFFATISEFEFVALSRFLGSTDSACRATWHLQFHFNIFEGRPHEYSRQQERLDWVRRCFNLASSALQGIRVRFYNTSQALADQYNQLEMVRFENLPYPVNPEIYPVPSAGKQALQMPLRVTCGGGVRIEKGQSQIAKVLSSVWKEQFLSGNLQLHVQSRQSHRNRLGLPVSKSETTQSPVVYWPHPLSPERYTEFIRESHIGLLLYDSRRYYARRAGVLGEFLSAGIPVLVPSGCWLSDQIAEAAFLYLDGITQSAAMTDAEEVDLRAVPISEKAATEHTIAVPSGASAMLVSLTSQSWPKGAYLRVSVLEHDLNENLPQNKTFSHVMAGREAGRPSRALWRVSCRTQKITITIRDEFSCGGFLIDQVQVNWIRGNKSPPLSAVGLAAADDRHVGVLLGEIAEHYDHYRTTALKFSENWRSEHDPMKTVQRLVEI
jgi:hypothetical protein